MSRLNPSNVITKSLDELIPVYAMNKSELDSYKKICDEENGTIKQLMLEAEVDSYTAGGYVAKRIVTHKESINEDRLMVLLKKYNIPDVIKTKEYVDMDALENYLYNTAISSEFASDLASCKSDTEVVQLRISKEKKKEDK